MQAIPVNCRVTKIFRSLLVPTCSRLVNIVAKRRVAGFEPRPRPMRRKTHWTKFADTDVNEDGAETQEERTFGVLQPLWMPSQVTSLCPLKRAAESMVGGRRFQCIEAVVDSGAEETVAPRGAFPGRARTSAMSRAGELDVQFLTRVRGIQPSSVHSLLCLPTRKLEIRSSSTKKAAGSRITQAK